ncbi:MAG: DNA-3-methyladenine glycosylase 2 family protein [Proteobacteria bacterium]|uniref:DNA-3-methyladenine glycosylase n=1 Tax=Rudaea sp. TaxID=2136325 RepID=UPI00321FD90A|nr:DNA-3-methyladenine glycosylase 2 family protein [Pseudomonadota bacterium]
MSARTRLDYQPPHDFANLLGFFARRAIPGVEHVDEQSYRRIFILGGEVGEFTVTRAARGHALDLSIDGVDAAHAPDIATRVRRMFDLDADIAAINAHLGRRRQLKACVARHPGQRLPGGWDGFEIAIRAVLGQQVTVAAARTLTERVVRRFGHEVQTPQSGKVYLFPTPAALADADLGGLGITGARIATLRALAAAVRDGRVDFRAERPLAEFVHMWTALPGIGEWTAHYLAMRGLAHTDAFPAGDIVLRKAVARDGQPVTTRALEEMSQAWRPYRAYAVLHLWRSTMI